MGLLQHDTNNIIVDAVLTDVGRAFLARNDGSFSIVKFAASDDEVNYAIIKQFGRTVGKEKIEKNTAIFEALTNGQHAQKYRCVSLSNPNLVRLPNIRIISGLTSGIVSLGRAIEKVKTLRFEQQIVNEVAVDPELRDQVFIVEMNHLFLRIVGAEPDNVDGHQRATYLLTRDATGTALQGSSVTFTVAVQAITDAQFDVFGHTATGGATKGVIRTNLRVSGLQSGAVSEVQVNVSRTS